jgi:predicted aspartyl protease
MKTVKFAARFSAGCTLSLLVGLTWSQDPAVLEAVRTFREPMRLGSPLHIEGRMISNALARNEAGFIYQQDRGFARMQVSISGRLQETWRTPEGTFLYLDGLIRAPGTQERVSGDQDRLEQRLFTQLLLKPGELQEAGDIRLPDGSPARWWTTQVKLGHHEYSLSLYLHPLKRQLRGYALRAKHPLRDEIVERTVIYNDYRLISDRSVPYLKREYYEGKLFNEMRVRKVEKRVRQDLPTQWQLLRTQQVYAGRLPTTLPLTKRNMLLVMEVELMNDKARMKARMLVDTGASTTILLSKTAQQLNLKPFGDLGARPIGTDIRLQGAKLQSLKMGTVRLVNRWVAVGNLEMLGMVLSVDGILGSDVLGLFRTTFDFQQNKITLEDIRTKTPPAGKHTIELPLDSLLGIPVFKVWMEDKRSGWMILDTGARFTVLPNKMVTDELRKNSPVITPAAGASGISAMLKGSRFASLSLYDPKKGLKIEPAAALFPADPKQNILPGTDIGVIGMNLLRRYRLTLDYQNGTARFTPFNNPNDRESDIGIRLNYARPHAEILGIVPLSPAQEAGLQKGDQLLKVNNRSTEGIEPVEIQKWLRGAEGSSVRLLLQRDTETLEVNLLRETLIL